MSTAAPMAVESLYSPSPSPDSAVALGFLRLWCEMATAACESRAMSATSPISRPCSPSPDVSFDAVHLQVVRPGVQDDPHRPYARHQPPQRRLVGRVRVRTADEVDLVQVRVPLRQSRLDVGGRLFTDPQHVARDGGCAQEQPAARHGGDCRADERALSGLLASVEERDRAHVGDQSGDGGRSVFGSPVQAGVAQADQPRRQCLFVRGLLVRLGRLDQVEQIQSVRPAVPVAVFRGTFARRVRGRPPRCASIREADMSPPVTLGAITMPRQRGSRRMRRCVIGTIALRIARTAPVERRPHDVAIHRPRARTSPCATRRRSCATRTAPCQAARWARCQAPAGRPRTTCGEHLRHRSTTAMNRA